MRKPLSNSCKFGVFLVGMTILSDTIKSQDNFYNKNMPYVQSGVSLVRVDINLYTHTCIALVEFKLEQSLAD